MFTHKVIWGTLWALAELVSMSTSAGSRDPSPSSSERSDREDLPGQWVMGVEGAVRNAHSLEPLLGAPAVSGPNSPVWMITTHEILQLAPGKNPNELFKQAQEKDVNEDELKLMKKNAERAFLAYCPEKIIKQLETSHEVVTNENLGMKDEKKQTRKEFFIIPENSVKIMKTHYPRMWARSAFGITGIGVVVLVDEKTKEIVVSVRGTIGLMNWITDAAITVISARHMCQGCYMHSGFWVATHEIYKTVRDEIKRLWALPEYQSFTLTVTGHSLGGAVAYLLRLHFAANKEFCNDAPIPIDLVTFGQPKAGNKELAMWAEKLPGRYLRVTHSDDLVVSMPASFGWTALGTGYYYVHTRNEYHIKPFPDPNCQNIPVDDWKTTHVKKMVSEDWFYNGGTHKVGRYGLPIPTKFSPISSHSLYLYRTNICSTKPPKFKDPPTTLLEKVKPPSLDELLVQLGIDAATAPHGSGIIGNAWGEWERIVPSINAAANPQGSGSIEGLD